MPRTLLIIFLLICVGLACKNGTGSATPTTSEPNACNNTNISEAGAGDSARTGDSRTIAGGVLNDQATQMPAPVYPPTARAVRAAGKVVVNIEVAPDGSVVHAKAESGHPLLKAEAAARQAKFKPGPAPISGSLEYEFTAP